MSVQAVREELAALVRAAGVSCVTNPTALDPPGAVVGVPDLEKVNRAQCLTLTATIPIHVVSPAPGNDEQLAVMLSQTETIFETLDVVTEATAVQFDRGEVQLPAYRLEVMRNIEIQGA